MNGKASIWLALAIVVAFVVALVLVGPGNDVPVNASTRTIITDSSTSTVAP